MVNALPGMEPGKDPFLLAVQFRGNQLQDRSAYDLGSCIPEYAASAFVPTGDNPVQVHTDDGVIR
jgi:hypothetical protein